MRRIGAAAVLAVCLIVLAGPAAADETQTLSISGVSVGEGGGTATFTVTLSDGPDPSATVDFATANGSATAGADYTGTSGNLTVPAGGSETIQVTILDDSLDEPNQTFTVNLSNAVGAVIGTASATGTITDDDATPTLAITGPATVNEADGTATYSVAITGQSAGTVSVNFAAAGGTASAGSDFTLTPGSLSWASGDTAPKPIVVTISNDALDEVNETFSVNLSGASGATIADGNAGTTINDNDDPPTTTTFANVSVSEGNSSTVNANFTVNLSGPSGKTITVNYSTIDGTATNANNDYEPKINQNLTIPPGQTSGTISIAVNGDAVPEPNETFTVNLNSGTEVTLGGDTQAVGTIVNDDNAVTASINDVTVTEGNSPSTVNATFTVSLSGPAQAPVTITYRTADGSATSPADYTGVPDTVLNIAQNASSGQITIVVKGDGLPESNENFFVDLVGSTGPVSIADSRGTGTITDDDSTPSASIDDVVVTEGHTGTVNATFTVSLSGPAPAAATITYRTADGSATSPADYTGVGNTSLPIAQNATSAQITIVVKGDGLPEGTSENFFVDLVGSTGPVTVGADSRGIGTITDDDNPVTASINDVPVTEGHAPTTVNATFTVTLSGPAPAQVQIRYSTTDGSALQPGDYTPVANAILTIAQGASSGTFSIVVKGDGLPEGAGSPLSETFFVDLQSVVSGPATIGADSRGIGTIVDDDNPVLASINDATVTEGHTPTTVSATFTVSLSGPAPAQVQIRYSTINGSAVSPGDFTGVSNVQLTIPQGSSGGTFSIAVKGDTVPEGTGSPLAETFSVDLISASGPATLSSDSRGIGTIVDDDSPVTASINDVSVTEGNAGMVNATFTVSLSGPASAPVQVRYSSLNSSAVAPGDYTAVTNALLSIAQGASSGQFSIVVNGDTAYEGETEDFFVDLISATGPATISADSRGRGTIVEDDPAPPSPPGSGGQSVPSLSISDVLAREGVDASFTLTLTGSTAKTVTVRATTVNATASAGSDYVSRDEVLTFAPGETTKTIVLTVLDDTVAEETETFWVRLSQPSNATIAKTIGTATIEANDQVNPTGGPGPNAGPTVLLPRMILGPPSVTVGANGVAVMRVTCTKASPIACIGLVALETITKPKFQLGKKKFVAKKGKKTSVQIRLSARALKRLLKTGSLRVRAIVVVRNSKKKTLRFVPGVVTLKASQALISKATEEVQTIQTTPKPAPPPKVIVDPEPKPKPAPKVIVDP